MIRAAEPNDIPSLIDSMNKLVVHVQTRSDDVYMQDLEKAGNENLTVMFLQALDDLDTQVLVSVHNGSYAGFIYGKISTPFIPTSTIKHIGLIEMCWVEKTHRNSGIGRSLAQAIEDWFREKNVNYVDLHYLLGNTEAEASWNKLGYNPFRVTARKEL